MKLRDNHRGAILSDDRTYRYRLWRIWDVEKPAVAFVMLNPSTADETEDDPTIRRCLGFAKKWGYGKLIVGNLFAYRATDPDEIYQVDDPIGPANDHHLEDIATETDMVVAAWGTKGEYMGRGSKVVKYLDIDFHALDTTDAGYPSHPLYLPKTAEPTPYDISPKRASGETE